MTAPSIFISHSHHDGAIVHEFKKLIQLSIDGVGKKDLRATSEPATGLVAGEWITAQLRTDVRSCRCFIAVVSDAYLSSRFCAWELGVRLGAENAKFFAGYLPGIDPSKLGDVLSGANVVPLSDAKTVEQLLHDITIALRGEDKGCQPDQDELETFCKKAAQHPPNPIENWRKSLVQLVATDKVFLNAYGLGEPGRGPVFQDFRPQGANIQPVQYLWADPGLGNWIRAELKTAGKTKKENFLRITFHHALNSFGCNLAIRPQGQRAILTEGAKGLTLSARVADESSLGEVGIRARLVNGYMQHWESTTAEFAKVVKGKFRKITLPLTPSGWSLFGADGTGTAGPKAADFSILTSVNLALGGYTENARQPTAGDGVLDIREIRLT